VFVDEVEIHVRAGDELCRGQSRMAAQREGLRTRQHERAGQRTGVRHRVGAEALQSVAIGQD